MRGYQNARSVRGPRARARRAAPTPHTDRVHRALDLFARFTGRIDGQLGADQLDRIGAGERGLVDVLGDLCCVRAQLRGAHLGCAAGAAMYTRGEVRVAVQRESALIGAPLRFELAHATDSGLGGRVAFCAAASCAAVGSPSTRTRLLRAHSRSRVERCDHTLMVCLVTPAISAIPVCGSTGCHSTPSQRAGSGAGWPDRSSRAALAS